MHINLFVFFKIICLHVLFPSCLAVCGHRLPPRIAIAFSLLSKVPKFSTSRPSIFLVSSSNTFLSLYSPRSPTGFYFRLRCHKGSSLRLVPPPSDYWYTPFFFLASPGPLHENAVSAFSRSPLDRANTFSFLSVILAPRTSLNVLRTSRCLLALASLSLSCIISFASVLYLANLSIMDSTSSLVTSWLRPYFFDYAITPYSSSPFFAALTSNPSAIAGNLFFGMFPTLYCHFNFLMSLLIFQWLHSQFCC